MFYRTRRFVLTTLGTLVLACNVHAAQKFKILADPSLPDIAAVSYPPGEDPVILFNPALCKQAGEALCTFYRYHEYGHIALRHNERDDLSLQEKERQADQWAARHAPLTSVVAAYRFFLSGGGSTPVHGSGASRAARMEERGKSVVLLAASLPVPR
ncbi:MAG TPA: hypothetical protein ENK05_00595 [Gammaproteobacteria bacterium]|nr:hypothetical protein [Gammaproteobacteria bacterium]